MAVCTSRTLGIASSMRARQDVERVGRQIEEVGPADAVAGRAGHLPGEQIEQVGELAPRLQAGLGVGQRAKRIDAEDVGHRSPPFGCDLVPSPFGRGLG